MPTEVNYDMLRPILFSVKQYYKRILSDELTKVKLNVLTNQIGAINQEIKKLKEPQPNDTAFDLEAIIFDMGMSYLGGWVTKGIGTFIVGKIADKLTGENSFKSLNQNFGKKVDIEVDLEQYGVSSYEFDLTNLIDNYHSRAQTIVDKAKRNEQKSVIKVAAEALVGDILSVVHKKMVDNIEKTKESAVRRKKLYNDENLLKTSIDDLDSIVKTTIEALIDEEFSHLAKMLQEQPKDSLPLATYYNAFNAFMDASLTPDNNFNLDKNMAAQISGLIKNFQTRVLFTGKTIFSSYFTMYPPLTQNLNYFRFIRKEEISWLDIMEFHGVLTKENIFKLMEVEQVSVPVYKAVHRLAKSPIPYLPSVGTSGIWINEEKSLTDNWAKEKWGLSKSDYHEKESQYYFNIYMVLLTLDYTTSPKNGGLHDYISLMFEERVILKDGTEKVKRPLYILLEKISPSQLEFVGEVKGSKKYITVDFNESLIKRTTALLNKIKDPFSYVWIKPSDEEHKNVVCYCYLR